MASPRFPQTTIWLVVGVAVVVLAAGGAAAIVWHPTSASLSVHKPPPGTSTSSPSSSIPTTSTSPPTSTTRPTPAPGAVVPAGVAVPPGFLPSSVTFVSPALGWALGTAPCGTGRCTVMARTDSAGWAWRTVSAPPGAVTDVRFATPAAGYAYGADVVDFTADGGATWRPAALAPGPYGTFLSLEVGAGQVFLAARAGVGSASSVVLFRAPSGGAMFAAVAGVGLPGVGLASGATGRLSFDGRFGYLSGDFPAAGLMVSTDGGTIWTHRALPCPPGLDAESLVAPSAGGGGELQVVCSAVGAGGMFAKSLFFSVDGATTFHPDPAATPPELGRLEDLSAPGAAGLVMATASADSDLFALQGETWATVAHISSGGIDWHDLGFTTATQGVVVLGGRDGGQSGQAGPDPTPIGDGSGLYMTRDGGRHWAVVDFAVSSLPPRCTPSQLTLTQPTDAGDIGLGNVMIPIVLNNHASQPCSLQGYPGLTLDDASGRVLTNTMTRSTTSYFLQESSVEPVVLAAGGGTATFFVSFGDNPVDNETSCPAATRARVIPPGDTQSVTGPVDVQPCGSLFVSPLLAGTQLG